MSADGQDGTADMLGREERIAIIANRKSGTNQREAAAITRAHEVLGHERATLYPWEPGKPLAPVVGRARKDGASVFVAAGGDGTATALASELVGTGCALAPLPLGTFNYFARGLGLSIDPAEAAGAIASGVRKDIRVGTVNGTVFLNNASLGVYPAILKQRESIYARWGRRRMVAHWSVMRTFLRFQRPMTMTLEAEGFHERRRTPLLFVSRSAFQLQRFGLSGAEAISDDAFAVLIARASTRADLFRLAFRLVRQEAREGRDYDYVKTSALDVDLGDRRALLAHDGEKALQPSPIRFRMADKPLTLILPTAHSAVRSEPAAA